MTNEQAATNGIKNGEEASTTVFNPPKKVQEKAYVKSMTEYEEMYERSINDPEGFWKDIAQEFYWKQGPKGKFFDYNIDVRKGPVYIKWMEGAKTNISFNLLDRNIERGLGSNVAFFW